MKVNTGKLKEISNKVGRLIGSNSVMDICNYLELVYMDGQLILTATDKTRAITGRVDVDEQEAEEFEVVIEGQKFVSLVRNTNTSEIKLIPKEKHFEFRGNGKYKLNYYTGDFFNYFVNPDDVLNLDAESLINMVNRHDDTVSKEIDVMSGYYFDNEYLITLDGQKMALTKNDLFDEDITLLIPEELATMIPLFEKEGNIQLMIDGKKLLFTNDNLTIFGGQLFGLDKFPDVSNFKEVEYDNWVEIKSSILEAVLKRVELFTEEESDYGILVKLVDGELIIRDAKEASTETLDIENGEGEFETYLTLPHLKLFLKNLKTYSIRLGYEEGQPALRVSDGSSDGVSTNYFSAVLIEI